MQRWAARVFFEEGCKRKVCEQPCVFVSRAKLLHVELCMQHHADSRFHFLKTHLGGLSLTLTRMGLRKSVGLSRISTLFQRHNTYQFTKTNDSFTSITKTLESQAPKESLVNGAVEAEDNQDGDSTKDAKIKLALDKLKEAKKIEDESKSEHADVELKEDSSAKPVTERSRERERERSKAKERDSRGGDSDRESRGRDSDREREKELERDRGSHKERSHRSKDRGSGHSEKSRHHSSRDRSDYHSSHSSREKERHQHHQYS